MIVIVFKEGEEAVEYAVEIPNQIPEYPGELLEDRVDELHVQWAFAYEREVNRHNDGLPYDTLIYRPDRTVGECFARYLGAHRIPSREVGTIVIKP